MLLAAGRGERMRPLTDTTPKPLLEVAGKPLIVHLIESLARAGIRELVLNLAHLGALIEERLGDGGGLGVDVRYSPERPRALESAGGIRHALPLLGNAPFLVVNADLWTDYPFGALPEAPAGDAHLVLVDNPPHHRAGDFSLVDGRVGNAPAPRLTFAGIGVYRPALFSALAEGPQPLAPLLRSAAEGGRVTGERFAGDWVDVGTPQRLAALHARLGQR